MYDANGNLQQLYGDVHTFDVENRFKSTTTSGVTTSFFYNGDGRTASHFRHKSPAWTRCGVMPCENG